MFTQLHHEIARSPRPTPRVIEGWPPPDKHPPPRTRARRRAALSLARLARHIDESAARQVIVR